MKALHQSSLLGLAMLAAVSAVADDGAVPGGLDVSSSAWQFRFSGLEDDSSNGASSSGAAYTKALGDAPRFSSLTPLPSLGRDTGSVSGASVKLRTPGLGDLSGHFGVVGEDSTNPVAEPDWKPGTSDWELGATLDTGGLFLGAGYRYLTDRDADWGIGGGYTVGDLQLSAAYRRSRDPDIFGSPDALRPHAGALGLPATIAVDSGDGQIIDLGFQYRFGRSRARLGYSRLQGSATSGGSALNLKLDRWVVGIDHGVDRDLDVFAEFQYSNSETDDQPGSSSDAFGLGLRHRF